MTCLHCGEPIVQPKTGRRRKWCSDACKVAAHRKKVRSTPGLTLPELAERLTAAGEPMTVVRVYELLLGLNPGYVERVGSVWTVTPLCLQAFGAARSSFVPLDRGEKHHHRIKPGPRQEVAA